MNINDNYSYRNVNQKETSIELNKIYAVIVTCMIIIQPHVQRSLYICGEKVQYFSKLLKCPFVRMA